MSQQIFSCLFILLLYCFSHSIIVGIALDGYLASNLLSSRDMCMVVKPESCVS